MEALVHVEFPGGTGLFYLQRRFVFTLVEWFSKRMRMLVDNGACRRNAIEKLGPECHPIVSQK